MNRNIYGSIEKFNESTASEKTASQFSQLSEIDLTGEYPKPLGDEVAAGTQELSKLHPETPRRLDIAYTREPLPRVSVRVRLCRPLKLN